MKQISGYVRDVDGTPLPAVNVSVKHADGTPVPTSDAIWVTSAQNPVATDVNGYFIWTTELSPGPLYAEVTYNGQTRVRDSREVMHEDEVWTGDALEGNQHLATGYTEDVGSEHAVTIPAGTRTLLVGTGQHVIKGRVFRTDSTRTLTGDANTTLAERWDLVVLEQHVSGMYKGRQYVRIVKGTVNATDPAINASADIFQVAIARAKLPQNATAYSVVVDLRVASLPIGTQPLDATLTALSAYNANGLIAQTAADAFAGRTITGTADQITVTNGDGVSGNPTLSLPSAVTLPGSLEVTGNATLNGNTTLGNAAGDLVTVTGTATFAEVVTLNQDLIVNGNTTLGNAAGDLVTVTGTPTFAENVTLTKDLIVNGNTTLGNAAGDLVTVTGTPTFAENVTLTKDLIVNGNTTLGNAAGDLITVTGTPTFAENVTLTKNLIVNGNTTLGNAAGDLITVTGKPTFAEAATFSDTVTVDNLVVSTGYFQTPVQAAGVDGMSILIEPGYSGTGTNIAGGDVDIYSGIGTGNAVSSIAFHAVEPKAPGTTRQDTWTQRLLVNNSGISVTGSLSVDTNRIMQVVDSSATTETKNWTGITTEQTFTTTVGITDPPSYAAGDVFRFTVYGTYARTGTPNLTLKLYFGGALCFSTGAVAVAADGDFAIHVVMRRGTGASTSNHRCTGTAYMGASPGTPTVRFDNRQVAGQGNSGAKSLSFSAQFSAASASNTCSLDNLVLESSAI